MRENVWEWERSEGREGEIGGDACDRKKPPRAFGCSSAEDKAFWCLLTGPMIHNWGRTAVAGCSDRPQGGWQMIEPSRAQLSISPNVHCPPSAHLSFTNLLGSIYVNQSSRSADRPQARSNDRCVTGQSIGAADKQLRRCINVYASRDR